VAPKITNVSEEGIASIIRVRKISEPGTTLAATSNCSAAKMYSDDESDTFLRNFGS
jgi:hypothetical protein